MRIVVYYITRGKKLERVSQPVVAEFVDSGPVVARKDWPILKKAISAARKHRARLVIAKLGRLDRSLVLLRLLRGVDFCCLDHPLDSESLDSQIEITQEWTQALANTMRDCASKKTGFAVRGHRRSTACVAGARRGVKNAAVARSQRAQAAYRYLIPRVQAMRKTMTWMQIVEVLNREGQLTTAGKPFNHPTLIRLMQRAT